jgi:predicted RNA-binding Zn-ribbon protein involved in translation (DUF1610 family)
MIDCLDLPRLESKKARYQAKYHSNRGQGLRLSHYFDSGFYCNHCQASISTDAMLSGVQNRNHCPYCLWSRHLDLYEAGDRLAACKAAMKPIGLTMKQTRKKYASVQPGELMIIHLCTGCGSVSINRIAADDDVKTIREVYENSCQLDAQTIARLENSGVVVLRDVYPSPDFRFAN